MYNVGKGSFSDRRLRVRAKITSQNGRSDFGSDLADPIEQNRRHSRLCRGFASEVSGKDGRKPRWQNVKLFLREP